MSDTDSIPYGYCHCRCGQKTNLTPSNNKHYGWIKGEPKKYIRGHNNPRKGKFKQGPKYLVEDRGHETPCWIWQREKTKFGHGLSGPKESRKAAHRVYYEAAYGPIPDNRNLHHLCEQPPCVNPDHLQVVTPKAHPTLHRKLSPLQEREVAKLYATGQYSYRLLGEMFGVSRSTIGLSIHRTATNAP